jgi:hypothetical protein
MTPKIACHQTPYPPPFPPTTTEAESKEKHGVWDPMPELTITSPYARVDSNTFTMGNPMPESTLTLCQSRLPVRDFGFGLRTQTFVCTYIEAQRVLNYCFGGPGFLAVLWFGSSPTPSPSQLTASCLSFWLFLCVAGQVYWWERGGQIVRRRESPVLY